MIILNLNICKIKCIVYKNKGVSVIVKKPFINDYCEKCKYHFLLDGHEDRCGTIVLGSSYAMCAQIAECSYYKYEANEK